MVYKPIPTTLFMDIQKLVRKDPKKHERFHTHKKKKKKEKIQVKRAQIMLKSDNSLILEAKS